MSILFSFLRKIVYPRRSGVRPVWSLLTSCRRVFTSVLRVLFRVPWLLSAHPPRTGQRIFLEKVFGELISWRAYGWALSGRISDGGKLVWTWRRSFDMATRLHDDHGAEPKPCKYRALEQTTNAGVTGLNGAVRPFCRFFRSFCRMPTRNCPIEVEDVQSCRARLRKCGRNGGF